MPITWWLSVPDTSANARSSSLTVSTLLFMPKIAAANKLPPPINVFSAMGGTSGLECGYGERAFPVIHT